MPKPGVDRRAVGEVPPALRAGASSTEGDSLFFRPGIAASLRSAVRSDAFAASVAATVMTRAEALFEAPVLSLLLEPGRTVMLPTARALAERTAHFGVAALLTGANRFRRRGIAELQAAASLATWNPGHFLDVAEMASAFAVGLDAFGPALSRREAQALDDALAEKALRPGLDQLRDRAFWTTATHNWNTVCSGGLIVAALAVGPAHAALAEDVLGLGLAAIRHGLSAYGRDGGYPEGPGYAALSTYHAVLALAALGARGRPLPEHGGLVASWRFHRETTAPSGRCFDFGDTPADPGRPAILGWLAEADGAPQAAAWQRTAPGTRHPFDLLWLSSDPGTEAGPSPQRASVFETAGIGVLRDDAPDRQLYVGLKGGRNDVNHAHRDLGSFILEWGGSRFVGELGRDDYALPFYFDPERRHVYFRLSAEGHGGLGDDSRPPSADASGRFLDLSARPAIAVEIEDPASAFRHRRDVALAGETISILDEVVRKTPGEGPIRLDWRVYTEAAVACRGNVADLVLDGRRLVFAIEGVDATWTAEPARSPPGEGDNAAFTRLGFTVDLESEAISVRVVISEGFDDGHLASAAGIAPVPFEDEETRHGG